MYLVRARSDLICAIKSRARHAMRNAKSSFLRRTMYARYEKSTAKETENNSPRLHSSTRRTNQASFFFTSGRSNSIECRKVSENYVNSRDEKQVNAIQEIGIKVLTVQNSYTVTTNT